MSFSPYPMINLLRSYYAMPDNVSRDGLLEAVKVAADTLEESDWHVSANAEFRYLTEYATASGFEGSLCREQLRSLWTAFCIHHDFDVDTYGYDRRLEALWERIRESGNAASAWGDYDDFCGFMCIDTPHG